MYYDVLESIGMSCKGDSKIPRDQKGDRFVITAKDKKILIQKATNVEKHIEYNFSDLLRYSESSLEKLWNNKKDDVWEKYL